MKRLISLLTGCALLLALTACGNRSSQVSPAPDAEPSAAATEQTELTEHRILIAYFN